MNAFYTYDVFILIWSQLLFKNWNHDAYILVFNICASIGAYYMEAASFCV